MQDRAIRTRRSRRQASSSSCPAYPRHLCVRPGVRGRDRGRRRRRDRLVPADRSRAHADNRFIAAMPGAALVPVAALLLGPSQLSGVVAVALIVSWPILLNTATAVRSIPPVRLEMSRTIGLSRAQRWGKVIVPSLIPGAMLGVRVAASLAVIITLLVDIFGAGMGLGRLLVESQQRFDAVGGVGAAGHRRPLRLCDEPGPFVAGARDRPCRTASRPRASACVVDQRSTAGAISLPTPGGHPHLFSSSLDRHGPRWCERKASAARRLLGRLPRPIYIMISRSLRSNGHRTLSEAPALRRRHIAVPLVGHGQVWSAMLP